MCKISFECVLVLSFDTLTGRVNAKYIRKIHIVSQICDIMCLNWLFKTRYLFKLLVCIPFLDVLNET